MNRSTPGLPVHHQLPEFTQTHVHRVSDAIQPSHPLLSPSPPAPNPSQHQSLFQWVNSAWSGQSTGVSALASFLPKKSQGWSPSEWTGWLSLLHLLKMLFLSPNAQKGLALLVPLPLGSPPSSPNLISSFYSPSIWTSLMSVIIFFALLVIKFLIPITSVSLWVLSLSLEF